MFSSEFEKVSSNRLKRHLLSKSKDLRALQKATDRGEDRGIIDTYKSLIKEHLPKTKAEINKVNKWPTGTIERKPRIAAHKPTLDEMISGRHRYKNKSGTFSVVDLRNNTAYHNLVAAYDVRTKSLIGKLKYGTERKGKYIPEYVAVNKDSRRQGVATALYDHVGKRGPKISPDDPGFQTEEVKAFWKNRNKRD